MEDKIITAEKIESGETTSPQAPSLAVEGDSEVVKNEVKEQSKEDNARFARERREREQRERLRKAEEKGKIDTIIQTVGKNPFTGEELKDALDVEEYLAMKSIADGGGNPLLDYVKSQKDRSRLEGKGAPDTKWLAMDAKEFASKVSEEERKELFKDEIFKGFALKSLGVLPMSEIYQNYKTLKDQIRREAIASLKEEMAREVANAKASPGSLTSEVGESDFSKEEIKKMSVEEIERNYDKVIRSIKRK